MFAWVLALAVSVTPHPRAVYQPNLSRSAQAAGNVLETVPLSLAQQCQGVSRILVAGAPLSVVRNTQAYCSKSDGTFVLVGANVPRLGRMGIQKEPASSQLLSDVRDLSQASWTKTNMTCVKNATGADGTPSSASTCTATANNATVEQTLTGLASHVRSSGASIRRANGTGNVLVTGNGVDFLDVTSALYVAMHNGCQFLRTTTYGDDIRDTAAQCFAGGGTLTVDGTSIGYILKLATSGDAVVVDFAQAEPLFWQTSPVFGASRAQDVLTVTTGAWPSSQGFFEALMTPQWTPQDNDTDPGYYVVVDSTPTNGIRLYHEASEDKAHTFVRNAGSASSELTSSWFNGGGYNAYPTPVVPLMRPRMWRTAWSAADNRLGLQGFTWTGPVVRDQMPTGQGLAHLGGLNDDTLPWSGWIAWPRVGTVVADSHIMISTIGDSIEDGANTVKVGEAIQFNLGWRSFLVRPLALSGTRIATGANSCTDQFGTSGPGSVGAANNLIIYECGVNDILAGTNGTDTWALSQTLLETMVSAGNKIVLRTISPCGGYAGCGSSSIDTYNGLARTWCTTQTTAVCRLVDAAAAYPAGLAKASIPSQLADECNNNPLGGVSDHLHPGNDCCVLDANHQSDAVRLFYPGVP